MTDRQNELLANFTQAAGELAIEALNGLEPAKRDAAADEMKAGAAHIRVIGVLDPVIVIVSLHSTVDRNIPPQAILRLGAAGPQDGDFN